MRLSKDFLWGGAIADFQAEGGYQEGGRGLSTHDFESAGSIDHPRCNTCRCPTAAAPQPRVTSLGPKACLTGPSPLFSPISTIPVTGCRFLWAFPEDIALMAGMGYNVFRFSICWSRIYPTGEESVPNEAGLKFYEEILDELEKHQMQP